MVLAEGKKYYTLPEIAKFGNVSVRTLRRWIAADRLSDFVYPFRKSPTEVLYRLEEPDETDRKNEAGEWIIPEGGVIYEGISSP